MNTDNGKLSKRGLARKVITATASEAPHVLDGLLYCGSRSITPTRPRPNSRVISRQIAYAWDFRADRGMGRVELLTKGVFCQK
jgi:hypothetical protein